MSIKIVHACNDNDISFLQKLTRYLSFGRYFYHTAATVGGGAERERGIDRAAYSSSGFKCIISLSELKIIVSADVPHTGNKFLNLIFHPQLRRGKENVNWGDFHPEIFRSNTSSISPLLLFTTKI